MKSILLATILLLSASSFAANDLDGRANCYDSAYKAVLNIVSMGLTRADRKYLVIKSTKINSIDKGLNNESVEDFTVIFGYKSGEMAGENFETHVILNESLSRPGTCNLKLYEAKF
jgi:hypothetical protein